MKRTFRTEQYQHLAIFSNKHIISNKGGIFKLCDEIEKMKKAERIKIAQRMLSSEKFTYDEIAYFTDLTLEEIKTLTNSQLFSSN